jgi:hypothetical protein
MMMSVTTQELVIMNDDVTKQVKTSNPVAPELMFQIFFLSQDQNQSVEVVETEEIDFWELIGRLNVGESVFIKNLEKFESPLKMNNEDTQKRGYFTRY